MASTPLTGIVYINNDISGSVQEKLVNQLFIDLLLTADEFDTIIDGYFADGYVDGYFLDSIKIRNQRVMVTRNYLKNDLPNNIPNRELADVILYVKYGLVNIVTKEGHKPTLALYNIYWGALGFH